MVRRDLLNSLAEKCKETERIHLKHRPKMLTLQREMNNINVSVTLIPIKGAFRIVMECFFKDVPEFTKTHFGKKAAETKRTLRKEGKKLVRVMVVTCKPSNYVKVCTVHNRKAQKFEKALDELYEKLQEFLQLGEEVLTLLHASLKTDE